MFTCDFCLLVLPLPCSLSHFLALEQLLVKRCVNRNSPGRSCHTCSSPPRPRGSQLVALTWGCAGQMAWLGATDQTWIWTCPRAFLSPSWTGWPVPCLPTPCCLTPVFLMVSVPLLCSFPPEGTSSSVCRAQRRGGLPESLPANITVGVLP